MCRQVGNRAWGVKLTWREQRQDPDTGETIFGPVMPLNFITNDYKNNEYKVSELIHLGTVH